MPITSMFHPQASYEGAWRDDKYYVNNSGQRVPSIPPPPPRTWAAIRNVHEHVTASFSPRPASFRSAQARIADRIKALTVNIDRWDQKITNRTPDQYLSEMSDRRESNHLKSTSDALPVGITLHSNRNERSEQSSISASSTSSDATVLQGKSSQWLSFPLIPGNQTNQGLHSLYSVQESAVASEENLNASTSLLLGSHTDPGIFEGLPFEDLPEYTGLESNYQDSGYYSIASDDQVSRDLQEILPENCDNKIVEEPLKANPPFTERTSRKSTPETTAVSVSFAFLPLKHADDSKESSFRKVSSRGPRKNVKRRFTSEEKEEINRKRKTGACEGCRSRKRKVG